MQRAGGAAMTHPITPPPELVRQWVEKSVSEHHPGVACSLFDRLATAAAQWGADQELEACAQWVEANFGQHSAHNLHQFRRPKPPSLKEQALGAVGRFTVNAHTNANEMNRDFDTIRRALEELPND